MKVAYLRISTEKQTLENQINEVEAFAKRKRLEVDHFTTETISGTIDSKYRKLEMLIEELQSGDTLIVTELSRLSRSLTDIMTIMGTLLKKGVVLYSIKEDYCFDNTISSKVLCFAFGLVAEIERELISMRTKEALAYRKKEGIVVGRKMGSGDKMRVLKLRKEYIKESLEHGEMISKICKEYDVSRNTMYRFIKRTHLKGCKRANQGRR